MGKDVTEARRRGLRRSKSAQFFSPDSRNGARLEGSMADAIAAYSAEIQAKVIRSGAHAGAIVFYDEMKLRAPVDEGTLRDSIYRWHDEKRSVDGRQRYLVGPNKGKAPHWFNVEYGHWRVNVVFTGPNGELIAVKERLATPQWVPAKPYARPTFDAKASMAIEAAMRRMKERMREINAGDVDGD